MKTYIIILGFLVLNACVTTKPIEANNFLGNYTAIGKDYSADLSINSDGSFLLKRKSLEVSSQCNGAWKYLGGDSIRITCDKASDPLQSISSGYIGGYSEKVLFINKDKIRLNNIILKRVKKK